MNCEMSNNYMMKYFDGETKETEEAQLKQHIQDCEKCRQEFDCMAEVFATLEVAEEFGPPESFEASVMAKVNEFEKKRTESRTKMLVILYNAAAVIAILSLIIFAADIRPEGISRAFDTFSQYLGSFNSLTAAVFGVVAGIFNIISGILFTLLQVFLSILKTYYYIFIAMIVLVFAIQKLYSIVEVNDGRKSS